MASTYSNLKFELIGTGDQSGTWGTTTNTNLGTAIEQALVGMATISSGFVTNSLTLTLTDTNAAQNARALVLNLTQALSGAGTLNVPAIQKPYMIINATGQTVTVKVTGLTGVAVPTGTRAFLYNNGTDVGDFFNYASSLTLGTALPITSGGTGTTSTTFVNLTTNVTGTLPIANGGTGTTSTTFVNLATNVTGTLPIANGGTGTTSTTFVNLATNVTGDLPFANLTQGSALSVLGVTGNATADVASIAAGTDNQVLRRSGTALDFGAVNLASTNAVTGTLPVANGGTGGATQAAARTGIGATTVGSNFFTLTNPSAITFPRMNADNTVSALDAATFRTAIGAGTGVGTVTSVSGTGTVQGLSLSGTVTGSGNITLGGSLSAVSLTTQVSGTLPVSSGGTGAASLTANNVLLGNGTSALQTVAPGSSGNVLTSNGTTWQSSAPAAGGFSNMTVFTSSGTWTIPAGVTKCKVIITGGGGSGAVVSAGGAQGVGGGGAGGTVIKVLSLSGGSASITIGAGAAAPSAGSSGSTGGASSFVYGATTLTANGGTGADYGNNTGGDGGTATGGDLNIRGGYGSGMSNAGVPGREVMGGASIWGGCAGTTSNYGAGGAGIMVGYGSAAGGNGVCTIEY